MHYYDIDNSVNYVDDHGASLQHGWCQRSGTWYLYLYLNVMYLFPLNFLTAKVPASSSPVKRVFSQGGIIRPHRARMSDKIFSQLILLKYNS